MRKNVRTGRWKSNLREYKNKQLRRRERRKRSRRDMKNLTVRGKLLRLQRKPKERMINNGMERRIRRPRETRLRSRKWVKMNSYFLKKAIR